MKREIIRVEPLATFLDQYKAPASTVTKHGDTIYVSGAPPFDPKTGEIFKGSIERQTELVLEQMKLCVETAGSSLDNVLKVNIYVTSVNMFPAVNEVYRRFFPKDSACANIHQCPRVEWRLRYRNGLHSRRLTHRRHSSGARRELGNEGGPARGSGSACVSVIWDRGFCRDERAADPCGMRGLPRPSLRVTRRWRSCGGFPGSA